jgi:hypothetical protein
LFVVFGFYAFFDPRGFFDNLATFPPYNVHFMHDIGAFQIGLGAMLILAAYAKDTLTAALTGAAAGQLVHLLAHIIDRDLGAKQSTTIPFLFVVTAVLSVGAYLQAKRAT